MFLFSRHGINETSLKRQKKYLAHLTLVKGLLIMWTTSKGKSSKMKRAFYLFLHFSVSLPRMNVEMNVNILRRMGVTKSFISSLPVFLSWSPSIVNSADSGRFIQVETLTSPNIAFLSMNLLSLFLSSCMVKLTNTDRVSSLVYLELTLFTPIDHYHHTEGAL